MADVTIPRLAVTDSYDGPPPRAGIGVWENIPHGTRAEPSLRFQSHNTGWYRPQANAWAFSNGGSDRLLLRASPQGNENGMVVDLSDDRRWVIEPFGFSAQPSLVRWEGLPTVSTPGQGSRSVRRGESAGSPIILVQPGSQRVGDAHREAWGMLDELLGICDALGIEGTPRE